MPTADRCAGIPGGRLQTYGGEIGAVGPGDTAFDHRDALVEFVAGTSWSEAAEDERRISVARRFGAAMAPFASGVYVNDLGDEGESGCGARTGRSSGLDWPS